MPKGCSICARPDVQLIDDDISLGVPFAALHEKYNASVGALHRHSKHLKTQEILTGDISNAEPTAAALKVLYQRANDLYRESRKKGDRLNAVRALKETRDIIELTLKITGELNNKTQIIHNHLHVSAEWAQLRGVMLQALIPYPEARAALVKALEDTEVLTENNYAEE